MGKVLLFLLAIGLWAAPVDDARRALTDAARSKEGDQRREAALALSLVPAKDPAVALLDQLAKDKDYQVRLAAIDTLGDLNEKRRIDLVRSALKDDVPEVAFAAAKALFSMKDPAGPHALMSVYDGDVKGRSNFFQKEIRDSWRRLKTPRSALFFAIENGVGFVPVPGVGAGYSALSSILADSDFSARAVSLLTVCTRKGKNCDEMLGTAFHDEDWTVRAAAIHIVTVGNFASRKPNVADLIADKKTKVRLRAAAAYLRMETSRAPKSMPIRKLS